ncbi:9932_t:CDS:2, partial [Entrophospora sp. SA101]
TRKIPPKRINLTTLISPVNYIGLVHKRLSKFSLDFEVRLKPPKAQETSHMWNQQIYHKDYMGKEDYQLTSLEKLEFFLLKSHLFDPDN